MNKAYEILCHCAPCPCSHFSVGSQKTIEQNIFARSSLVGCATSVRTSLFS